MAAKPFESTIQDLVYNVDVGIGLRLVKIGLSLLMILVIMLVFTVTQFKGLDNAEAMDYAQLGRNLLQFKSFRTQNVRPISIWYLAEKSPARDPQVMFHPDIMHPPLYPALLAAGYRVTGASFEPDRTSLNYAPERLVIIPLNHLFTLLSGLLVLLLGRKLFDAKVGLLGVLLFFLSATVWNDSISGSGVALLTFLALFAFYTLLLAAERQRAGSPALKWLIPLGLTLGACVAAFYTRYAGAVLVGPVCLFMLLAFKGRRRWVWMLGFVVLFSMAISPWLIRNQMVSGSILGLAPYTALESSTAFGEDTFERTLAPQFETGEIIRALQRKWIRRMTGFFRRDLLTLGDGFIFSLFAVSFLHRFVRKRVGTLRWSLLLGIMLMLAVAAFFGDATLRLVHIFWPLVLLYAVAYFIILLDRLNLPLRIFNIGIIILLVLSTAMPLIMAILPPRENPPYPPYFPPYIMHVTSMLEPEELMCSDMPWATAWYGQRNTVRLPRTVDEFYEINDFLRRISGLYFTNITRDKPYVRSLLRGPNRTWFPILEGRIPQDFPLTEGFPISNFDQLFLSDRRRWEE